ncbi:hydroxymethylglutaryl-CoA reductase (NADPH) [Sulfodiicoccus acidiphilus]|uniref:3-hydroxy-3-methylglutaryl coenzyme A reductase n=1 Tax=Sulfodiicoccus acidiphilus TaxID=1670455 RepID=A0A348B3K2_9CREN|nr:hydroxymethylglutaryl-CoA reductase (NADPH) [Sulfodiicoccus acidiphilus]BBD72754.1 hydroxymethylglutaryl-CoA reductase (NADPH) [Sulfodiicoccus acidiphilus]GGT99559.1 hydroxymethylglutaryl-CoA reductase (NADPH) [Sulfodiicoccus acidiphilus]
MEAEIDEVVEKVVRGEIQLHELDRVLSGNLSMVVRRLAVEKLTGTKLPSIGSTIIDYEEVKNRNAENVIGGTQLPLGVIGPLKVRGKWANGDFYVPLATTEGALIASVNRGAKAVTASDGVRVRILGDGMARAPVFKLDSVDEVDGFLSWIDANRAKIKEVAESTTSFGRLSSLETFVLGNNVWVRIVMETGDAMGMNMVTLAAEKVCELVQREYPAAKCVALSGNVCSDKKQSAINSLFGRGKTVVAEALIREEVLSSLLKTDAASVSDLNLRKNLLGSARAGSSQFNAHFANVIAALFIATGQDVAQVVESSMGFTWTEVRGRDLYISVTLPSLEVGTVGGGTRLPTQREALSIMGVQGSGNPPGSNAKKFAEIAAATVLAGELNLLSALSAGELGKAHRRLGRNFQS